jgi:hypothetical protein
MWDLRSPGRCSFISQITIILTKYQYTFFSRHNNQCIISRNYFLVTACTNSELYIQIINTSQFWNFFGLWRSVTNLYTSPRTIHLKKCQSEIWIKDRWATMSQICIFPLIKWLNKQLDLHDNYALRNGI